MLGLTTVAASPAVASFTLTAAGADAGTVGLVTTFSSFGVLGIVAWMFATGRLYPKVTVDEMRRDLVEARGQVTALNATIISDVVPALKDATAAAEKATRGARGDG